MKHEITTTTQGHKPTAERLAQEFIVSKLWEAAATRLLALTNTGYASVDSAMMGAPPKLEIIFNFGVGVDQIGFVAGKQRGIIVTKTADVLIEHVADSAMALVLGTLRKIPQSEAYLRAGLWQTRGAYPLGTFGGKSYGILGLGRIGAAIAKRTRCSMAFTSRRVAKRLRYSSKPAPPASNNCRSRVLQTQLLI